ncbi:L-asparaginase [Rhodoferax lithotrophicus]|uniref:L-asparaginase n=1 Tax=Rhodoferax lithotrophicus TaxID=2798804 RepID=A0ABM7MJA8_9BURK|nr:asparaginase [Rhodoferax sp. MIZ03]BCO26348.1 L-asparaginase [Rhodoferax sp. MIZ03]
MKKVVVLGTGGTIAGKASHASDNIGYTAAQVGVAELLAHVPGMAGVLAGRRLVSEQVAQVDSKDMSFAVWQSLLQRVHAHLQADDVQAVVITHGTDTLEETAFFLHSVLPAAQINAKPVVLTCAMRPASSLSPDGPQNLLDAVAVALTPGAHGVVAVCAGSVHGAADVQKSHTYRTDAFSSGDAGALGYVEEGGVRLLRNWPLVPVNQAQIAIKNIANQVSWPRVEIVMNYAGGSAVVVDALLQAVPGASPLRGLVVAATGNGTLHQDLEAALRRAVQAGVRVVRSTRCAQGRVLAAQHAEFAHSNGLSPVKARVTLMLELMEA